MSQLPDVIGFPLEEAIEHCKTMGYTVNILLARPVREFSGEKLRVVRFKLVSKNKGELTVVYEDTMKGGG
ncbi:MAG: hypothetical protein PHD36_00285 [Desulfotomaculaceae bacterium]|nr:hypothetical protein [Desulfotomaculaceae bacterium]